MKNKKLMICFSLLITSLSYGFIGDGPGGSGGRTCGTDRGQIARLEAEAREREQARIEREARERAEREAAENLRIITEKAKEGFKELNFTDNYTDNITLSMVVAVNGFMDENDYEYISNVICAQILFRQGWYEHTYLNFYKKMKHDNSERKEYLNDIVKNIDSSQSKSGKIKTIINVIKNIPEFSDSFKNRDYFSNDKVKFLNTYGTPRPGLFSNQSNMCRDSKAYHKYWAENIGKDMTVGEYHTALENLWNKQSASGHKIMLRPSEEIIRGIIVPDMEGIKALIDAYKATIRR